MKRKSIVKAGLLVSVAIGVGCVGDPPSSPSWTQDIQRLMVSGGCTLGPCHGSAPMMVAGKTNRMKIIVGMESANCQTVTAPGNGLINQSSPAASRFVTHPGEPDHTGGKIAGWMSAADTSAVKAEEWIMGGAPCP